jgi:flagellar operon protein
VAPDRIDRLRPVQEFQRPAIGQTGKGQFAEVLKAEQAKVKEDLKISAHASARLFEAGRTLTPDDTARLNEAIDKMAQKGSRESLVVMDDLALVVSVPNRTVITVVPGERQKDSIFTNIDSAIFVNGPDLSEGARGRTLYQSRPMAQEGGLLK